MNGAGSEARSLRLVTLVTMMSIAQAPHAAVFGTDDREYVTTTPGSPYSPVGMVDVGGLQATGTLVTRCDVLTVEHLYRSKLTISHDPRGERAQFYGFVGSKHPVSSEGTIIAAGGWKSQRKPDPYRYYDNVGSDWMIVRLDECLGDTLGWGRLVTKWPADGTIPGRFQDAGFPIDRDRRLGLSIDPDCAIRVVAPRVLFHDCATMRGNSGGPIFRLVTVDGVQRMEIVGIVSAASTYAPAAVAVRGQENVATAAWNVTYNVTSPSAGGSP